MSHIAFQERGYDVELDVDYVVVGSGAGGATVAASLARGGARVAVVEAGAWRDPEHYPSSAYGAMRDLFDDWGSTFTTGRAFWPVLQARTVGGTTVINSAICVRTPGDIFEQWQRELGFGGEALAESVWSHQDDLEAELGASDTPSEVGGRSNTLAHRAADGVGISSHPTKRFVRGCEGSGQCLQACRGGRKQSLNLIFVPEVLRRGGHVLSCAPVDKVRFEGRRAVGVTGRFKHPQTRRRGARFTVRARRAVVIAASATHSPALLLRSGVRSKALGRGFRAHPGTAIFGLYDDPVDMTVGATQGWASTHYRENPGFKLETLSLPPELVAARIKGGGTALVQRMTEYRSMASWIVAIRGESEGRIRSGLGGRPVVQFTPNRADMERLRTGAFKLACMHFAAGARKVLPGVHGLPVEIGPDEVGVFKDAPLDPKAWFGILSHLFGGCTMGRNPTTAVCDEQGRVYGYEGLVISDASAIPTNLGVNPQHTIMGLSRVRADQLLAQA